jgi:hypothetical protein
MAAGMRMKEPIRSARLGVRADGAENRCMSVCVLAQGGVSDRHDDD